MSQSRPPPENHNAKAEESAEPGASPMARFKTLTRGLLKVSREQLEQEQQRYEKQRSRPRKDEPAAPS